MEWPRPKVVIWNGASHSGKTSLATLLADRAAAEGFTVAGILAPPVYENCHLTGYNVVDIKTASQVSLTRQTNKSQEAGFLLQPEGLELGNKAINAAPADGAQFLIVDEFGQFELDGQGWRAAVDRMTLEFRGVMLLVVNQRLAKKVVSLYDQWRPELVPITEPYASDRILQLLRLSS